MIRCIIKMALTTAGLHMTASGVLPTGRNIHALDPYRMPSAAAVERGALAAQVRTHSPASMHSYRCSASGFVHFVWASGGAQPAGRIGLRWGGRVQGLGSGPRVRKGVRSVCPDHLATFLVCCFALLHSQAILDAHVTGNAGAFPETVAVNLWGLDAIKTKGESVAMVLHLVGARPVKEGTGRIARFELVRVT